MTSSVALKLAMEFRVINLDTVILIEKKAEDIFITVDELLINEKILNTKALQKLELIKKDFLTPDVAIVRSFFNFQVLTEFIEKLALEKVEQERLALEKTSRPLAYPEVFETIGKCSLTSVLGHGATAQVYLAYHSFLKKNVAIKVLSPKLIASSKNIEKNFLIEAQNSAKLEHNNLVRVLDAGKDHSYTYMVVEYIDGPNIAELIRQSGAIKPAQAIKIILDVCHALVVGGFFML